LALFADPSVAATVCVPAVLAGTTDVPEKLPEASVTGESGVRPRPAPSYVALTPLVPAKPVPVIVTVSPTLPLVGLSVIFGVTVKLAVALLLSASLAATVCASAVLAGTVKVAPEKLPSASVEVAGLIVTPEPA